MGDKKDKFTYYGGPSRAEILKKRKEANQKWINSLRRKFR